MGTLEEYLKCPCRPFAPGKRAAELMKAYWEARARGEKEGFVPLFVPAESERFTESFEWEEYIPLEKYRKEMLESLWRTERHGLKGKRQRPGSGRSNTATRTRTPVPWRAARTLTNL